MLRKSAERRRLEASVTATGKLSLTGEYVVLVSDGTGVSVSGKVKKHPHCLALKEKLEEKPFIKEPPPALLAFCATNTAELRQRLYWQKPKNWQNSFKR